MRHPAKLSNILGKLNNNSQRWYLLGRTSSEVFVMLVVVPHSLLFLWCCLLFIFTFLDYFSMPPALHTGFSGTWRFLPALSSTLATFDCLTFPSHFYRERYGFEWAFFTHRRFFSYAPSPHFFHNLLLSRPPWEPAILLWSLQGFMLGFRALKFAGLQGFLETQTWPICLFDSQQSTILIFRRIRI